MDERELKKYEKYFKDVKIGEKFRFRGPFGKVIYVKISEENIEAVYNPYNPQFDYQNQMKVQVSEMSVVRIVPEKLFNKKKE